MEVLKKGKSLAKRKLTTLFDTFRLPRHPDDDGDLNVHVFEQALASSQRSGESGPGQLVTPRPIVYRSRSGQFFKGHLAKLFQTSTNELVYSTTEHVWIQKGRLLVQ